MIDSLRRTARARFARSLAVPLILAAALAPLPAMAGEVGSFEISPIGYPRAEGTLRMEITIEVMGKKVTKPVVLAPGDIKPWTRPGRLPTDSDADYAQKLADAKGKASSDKAKAIADKINAAFMADFAKLGATAGSAPVIVTTKENVGGTLIETMAPYGAIVIPGVSKEQGNPIKITELKKGEKAILGEGGNGGRYIAPAKPSPGGRGALERATPGVVTFASSFEPDADFPDQLPSLVEFGVGDKIASVIPTEGMSDDDILQLLEQQLDAMGLFATFDPGLHRLTLDAPIPDGQFLMWGSTDSNLEFTMLFEGLEVPEPESIALLAAAAVLLVLRGRRRGARGVA